MLTSPTAVAQKIENFGQLLRSNSEECTGFGTDLLGDLHVRQSTEFAIRAQALPAIDILRSVTSVNAELLNQTGRLGCIREGDVADLLVVNRNPIEDISLLAQGGEHLPVIMKGGGFHKRTI